MTDDELTALAERLGKHGLCTEDPRQYSTVITVADAAAASSAILALMRERDKTWDEGAKALCVAHSARSEAEAELQSWKAHYYEDTKRFEARATLAESRLAKAVEALRIIHDTFAKDIEQGYRTKDKQFAITMAKPILSDITEAKGSDPTGRDSSA